MKDLMALVVDDDPSIRKLVRANLEQRGCHVRESCSGSGAIAELERSLPDLVILDLVIPEISGNDVIKWIRQRWDIPIIIISARHEEDLKVLALDSGADDFVTKPFGSEELMARVRAVMRRADPSDSDRGGGSIIVQGIEINLKARRVFVDGHDIHLTRTEFALLAELGRNLDVILTHDELLDRVWGKEYRGSSHYLHVYLGRIRKKLGPHYSPLLDSVPGIGYVLHREVTR